MKGKCAWVVTLLAIVLTLGLLSRHAASAADKPKDYPGRPITIQVGFGAGGSSDVGGPRTGRVPQENHRPASPGGK